MHSEATRCPASMAMIGFSRVRTHRSKFSLCPGLRGTLPQSHCEENSFTFGSVAVLAPSP